MHARTRLRRSAPTMLLAAALALGALGCEEPGDPATEDPAATDLEEDATADE